MSTKETYFDPDTVRAMVGEERYTAALRGVVARHGTDGLRGPNIVVGARIKAELDRQDAAEPPIEGDDLHARATAVLAERGKRIDELDELELLEVYAELDAEDGPSPGQIASEEAATRFAVTAAANKLLAPHREPDELQILTAVRAAEAEVAAGAS